MNEKLRMIGAAAHAMAQRHVAMAAVKFGVAVPEKPAASQTSKPTEEPSAASMWSKLVAKVNGGQEADVSDGEAAPKSAWANVLAKINGKQREG